MKHYSYMCSMISQSVRQRVNLDPQCIVAVMYDCPMTLSASTARHRLRLSQPMTLPRRFKAVNGNAYDKMFFP